MKNTPSVRMAFLPLEGDVTKKLLMMSEREIEARKNEYHEEVTSYVKACVAVDKVGGGGFGVALWVFLMFGLVCFKGLVGGFRGWCFVVGVLGLGIVEL